jgi:cold shock CspA family protein
MCGTSNEYSISDRFIRQLVSAFREAAPNQNPLTTDRWSDIIQYGDAGDGALEGAGYEQSTVTHVLGNRGFLFARANDGSRDFFVRIETTEFTPAEFSGLKLGQILMVLPSDDPPLEGRAWPAKHAMPA